MTHQQTKEKTFQKMRTTISTAIQISVGLLLILAASHAAAHGEETPGPNGGEIRMPGAFHTELLSDGSGVKVYLLDVQFKNPTVENSKVSVAALKDGKKIEAKCVPQGEAFSCVFPDLKMTKGTKLELSATRAGVSGNKVDYKWPLRFSKAESGVTPAAAPNKDAHSHGDHSHHH